MTKRMEKVNSVMQQEIAKIIELELNDPRLENQIVSVLRVDTASDLKYAKVFLSIYGDKPKQMVIDAIKSASGYIKKLLAPKLKTRCMPELDFRLDDSLSYSQKIETLLKEIKED